MVYLKRLSDYDVLPAVNHLIDPYVPVGASIFLAGLPKTLKTFMGIDWGYSIAMGMPWLAHPTMKGRVAYFPLESYFGVLRRAEARRVFHAKSKVDGDSLVYIPDPPISFAEETCSIDHHFAELRRAGFRPDLAIFDTWFKATAGAEVGGQLDMSVALKNQRRFQNMLTEWKVEDGLPEVTFLTIAHTDKKGLSLFGSIAQFADCDVLYMLQRDETTPNQATLSCVGARDIEEPPTITIEVQKVEIVTAKGKETNLVVSRKVPVQDQQMGETKQSKQDAKKAANDLILDELTFGTLGCFYRGPHSWTSYTEWFDLTKAQRGRQGLGNDTFNSTKDRLINAGRVRKSPDGLYQVVFQASPDPAVEPVWKEGLSAEEGAPDAPPPPDSWILRDPGVQEFRSIPGSSPRSAGSNCGTPGSAATEDRLDQNPVVPTARDTASKEVEETLADTAALLKKIEK
jgi:hypothetical protein